MPKWGQWLWGLLLLGVLTTRPTAAQNTPITAASTLLPLPAETRYGQGRLPLKAALKPLLPPAATAAVTDAVGRSIGRLSPATKAVGTATLQIRYGRVGRPELFDEERYSLRVTPI